MPKLEKLAPLVPTVLGVLVLSLTRWLFGAPI